MNIAAPFEKGIVRIADWCAAFDPARMARDRRRYLAEVSSLVSGADVEGTVVTARKTLSDGRRTLMVWFHAFLPEAADALRGLGGRYDKAAGAWIVPDDENLSPILVRLILEDLFRTFIDVDGGIAARLPGCSASRSVPTYELMAEPKFCDLPSIATSLMRKFDRDGARIRLFDLAAAKGATGCAFADPCSLGVGWYDGFATRHPFALLRLDCSDATPLAVSIDSMTGEALATAYLKSEGPLLARHAASIEFFGEPVVLPAEKVDEAYADAPLLAVAAGFRASA
jgi:hypothetical protein